MSGLLVIAAVVLVLCGLYRLVCPPEYRRCGDCSLVFRTSDEYEHFCSRCADKRRQEQFCGYGSSREQLKAEYRQQRKP